MNEFNTMVLNIAIIVFIITLVVVGIILYYSIRNSSFPPFETKCPTYYVLDASGTDCVFNTSAYEGVSSQKYPSLAQPPSDESCTKVSVNKFYQSGFDKDEILCAKNRWAQQCGVFWDGVTNNSNACFRQNSTMFPGNYGSTSSV